MAESTTPSTCPSRRTVVALGAGITVTACASALTACGGSSKPDAGPGGNATPGGTTSASASSSAPAANGEAPAAAKAAIDAKKVPVGGAIALPNDAGILAQPTAGKYVLYSAECTHKGVKLTTVSGTTTCSAHGSQFDALTGAVKKGPATSALPTLWQSA